MGSPYVDSGQSSSFLSPGTASQVLHITHSAYPIVILAMFLGGFIIQSIQSSKAGNESSVKDIPNGPNGRPSPKYPRPGEDNNGQQVDVDFSSTQKALFNWLSVAVIATFIGNAVNIIVHALTERPWWCGQPHAVRHSSSPSPAFLCIRTYRSLRSTLPLRYFSTRFSSYQWWTPSRHLH